MDYYSTLGVAKNATNDEIKKAYRSMAMKHHPDRGGDEKKFKEINKAYDVLSDPEKKRMVDAGIDPHNQQGRGFHGQGPFEFHFGGVPPGMEDIFTQFGFGFGGRPQRRNKSINVNVQLSLEEVFLGKDITAEVSMPDGQKKVVNISIPAGIENGQQIRYQGMGDCSISNMPAGDLIVNINVLRHKKFKREGNNLIHDIKINAWDAILGTSISLVNLDGKKLNITVPPGTQPDTVLSCRSEGLPDVRNSRIRGDLLIKIKIEIPKNLSNDQIKRIKEINGSI